MKLAKTNVCLYRSGLGSRETGFIFSFETMEIFVGLEVLYIILVNVLTLMISLLLFCVPEWMINICVAILNTNYISDPRLIILISITPWYNFAGAQDELVYVSCLDTLILNQMMTK